MTVAVAVTAVAPGVAGVRHPPGWKQPFPATVTVVETVKKDSRSCGAAIAGPAISCRDDVMTQNCENKSIEGPPGKQEAIPGNLEA